MASECHFLLFFMYEVMGICAPASHLRLKSLKHALSNVYLASFLVQWILSLDPLMPSQLCPISYCRVVFLRCVFTARDIYA